VLNAITTPSVNWAQLSMRILTARHVMAQEKSTKTAQKVFRSKSVVTKICVPHVIRQ